MNTAVLMRCSRCELEILDGAVYQTLRGQVCCERCAATPVAVEDQPDTLPPFITEIPIG